MPLGKKQSFFFFQQGGKHIMMCQDSLQAVGFTAPGSYQAPKVLPNCDSRKKKIKEHLQPVKKLSI